MPPDTRRQPRKRPTADTPTADPLDPLDALIRGAMRTASPRVKRWLSYFRRGQKAAGELAEGRVEASAPEAPAGPTKSTDV